MEQVDDYHGTVVRDPYHWLEQPAGTEDVRAWIDAQNALAESYLADIPEREQIKARLTKLWNYPKEGAPFARGGRYFQLRNTGRSGVLAVTDLRGGEYGTAWHEAGTRARKQNVEQADIWGFLHKSPELG